MLAVLIRPGITKKDRQSYLNRLDLYTRVDPEEYLQIFGFASSFALAGGGVPPAARGIRAAEEAASEAAEAGTAEAADTPSEVWNYGWAKRGWEIDQRFRDGSLPPLFRTIDNFADGVATSIKSIDLNATTYQDAARLTYRLNKYVDELGDYEGGRLSNVEVELSDISERTLNLIVPKGAMTEIQRAAIKAAEERASMVNRYPVKIVITPF